MWRWQREKNWDMSADTEILDQPDYFDPKAYDVLLSDVNHELLFGEIANRFGVEYLSPAPTYVATADNNTINGILFGSNYRPIVNLVIESKKFRQPRNIVFFGRYGITLFLLLRESVGSIGISRQHPERI